jgi:CheY-like chemotaxis protein
MISMREESIQLLSQKILILDDKQEVTNRIVELLRSDGFKSVHSLNAIHSFTSLLGYDLIISDIIWPANKRGSIFSTEYVGFDIMKYVLGTLKSTKVILMSQSAYDLGKIELILQAHGYFSLRDLNINILRVIHQVLLRSIHPQEDNTALQQTKFPQNIFHGTVIITETNQGVIMPTTTEIQGGVIDKLNIMEKILLQMYDDKLIRVDEAFKHEIQFKVAELRLEAQKHRPSMQRFQMFVDMVKRISTGCLPIVKFTDEFQKLIEKSIPKISVLLLSADPTDAARLRLNEEFREIQEKLQLATLRDYFVLHQRMALRPEDLSQALLDIKPQIVHFSGHGLPDGALYLENKLGQSHPVQPDTLSDLFKLVAEQVDCVLLNACYSERQAKAIVAHISYVIGMNRAISDKAAIAFTIGFYQALGAGHAIEEAYKFGCIQIGLQGISENLTPILLKKD